MKVDIEIAQNGVILRFPRKNADTPGAVMIVTSMDEMATVIRNELWSYDPVPPIVMDPGPLTREAGRQKVQDVLGEVEKTAGVPIPMYAGSADMAAAADSDEDA